MSSKVADLLVLKKEKPSLVSLLNSKLGEPKFTAKEKEKIKKYPKMAGAETESELEADICYSAADVKRFKLKEDGTFTVVERYGAGIGLGGTAIRNVAVGTAKRQVKLYMALQETYRKNK